MSRNRKKYILEKMSCCNPFNVHTVLKRSGLRPITEELVRRFPNLQMVVGQKICTQCRKKLQKWSPEVEEESRQLRSVPLVETSTSEDDIGNLSQPGTSAADTEFYTSDMELADLNTSLELIGESPIPKKKPADRYLKVKVKKVSDSVKRKIELGTGKTITEFHDAGLEMIAQLKEKFQSSGSRSEKLQVLTVLPKSWTVQKVQEEFGASNYMIRKAKVLVREQGILALPNPKVGKVVPKETENAVREFYLSDKISRQMPGMKDFVSIFLDGRKQHVQKHLVLCNLKQAYEVFKADHQSIKIGFSKFAELRPRQCVLAGSSGTHSVCVCTTHQNFKLMFTGANLDHATSGEFKHYRHCLAAIQCNPPRVECFFGECSECPGTGALHDKLETYMQNNMIDHLHYKQWTSTDRSNLETVFQTVADFLDSYEASIQRLLLHDFIAKQQATYLQNMKASMEPGVVLAIADFSENYSFIVQDASQSFHWNNLQATIHPFVCYYRKDVALEMTPQHTNLVIISECNIHDTVAVHLFQKLLIQFLSKTLGECPKKVCYFSDGCAAQYKNRKNFINLCLHETDFGVQAEWHFFATSHGKGPSDGIGGTVKWLAAKASLQRPYHDQITTPHQLFQFVDSKIENVNSVFVTRNDYEQEAEQLKERFSKTRTIPGTQKLHSFVPL